VFSDRRKSQIKRISELIVYIARSRPSIYRSQKKPGFRYLDSCS